MAKNNNNKNKVNCPICNKGLIKKYISQHIRGQHKNDNYCKIVCRGMTYNIFNSNNINFIKDEQFYCKLCNKKMNMNSRYKHFKTKLHTFLNNKKNLIYFDPIGYNKNCQIYEKTKEVFVDNNEKVTYQNNKSLINNGLSPINLNTNLNFNNNCNDNILNNNSNLIKKTNNKIESKLTSESLESEDFSCSKKSNSINNNNIKLSNTPIQKTFKRYSSKKNTKKKNSLISSWKINKIFKSKIIYSSSNSDSSSSFTPINSKRKTDYLWGPDADRIDKEVDDVIKRIEENIKKKKKK